MLSALHSRDGTGAVKSAAVGVTPRRARAPVAQGTERRTSNPKVGGSNPPGRIPCLPLLLRPGGRRTRGTRPEQQRILKQGERLPLRPPPVRGVRVCQARASRFRATSVPVFPTRDACRARGAQRRETFGPRRMSLISSLGVAKYNLPHGTNSRYCLSMNHENTPVDTSSADIGMSKPRLTGLELVNYRGFGGNRSRGRQGPGPGCRTLRCGAV
jgi:hypothetical protein